ncbi:GRB2-associated-binding protein 2-like [Mesocricetus auratus]|uniref:GRB2-associated-binding protein 2-like n=1 Tax=Mesocricetus auratus TaxID=10036 RepID=A0ABM2WVZ9_MESAU|nr:GRB2-associated-binding protein 2-like [Mesocricetus auratus]
MMTDSLPLELHTGSWLTQQPTSLSEQAGSSFQSTSDMSGSNEVVYAGWLKKSPPEKKLKCYAWKKRWFILRSGRMNGDPYVLEYYKNKHSKKPLRIINLNLCEQVDTGLTFNKKELQGSFVFDIKTSERTFYLVAETEADMNKWVQSICQVCGFKQAKEGTASLRSLSSVTHGPRSSPAEFRSSTQHLLRERKSSAPSHSGQPTFEPPVSSHIRPALFTSTPQEYLYLHQCASQKTKNVRNASFSQGTQQKSNTAIRKLAQGSGHCINGVSGQVYGFYSLPKPSQHNTKVKDSTYDLPRSLASHSHTKGRLTGSETDNEDAYTFKTSGNTLCREFGNLLVDNMEVPTTPLSAYEFSRTFTLDTTATPRVSATAPQPQPPKPSQASQTKTRRWGSPQQRPPVSENNSSAAAAIPRHKTLPAMDNMRLHRASSCETYKYPTRGRENDSWSAESPGKTIVGHSDSASSGDNYVPMSPGPHHFGPPGDPSTALPIHRCPNPGSEIQPPLVNRNLKPDGKTKPTPFDLRNNAVIDELPFKSPVTKSWSRVNHAFNSSPSQYCRPISTQNISSTDSGDSEESYVPMQNPVSASPVPSGTNSPALKKNTGNMDYLALDLQPGSPGPHHKPSTSSATSDEKTDYVQVDKEKTQALQITTQEWTEMRQEKIRKMAPVTGFERGQ